jgi:hypothetical protein
LDKDLSRAVEFGRNDYSGIELIKLLMDGTIRLFPIADLGPVSSGGEIVAVNVGPDGSIYAVVASRPLDYRLERQGGASFAKTIPAQPQNYRVVGMSRGKAVVDVRIANEKFNIHDVQPLSSDELLLACCRSHYYGPDDFEKNGRVYNRDGVFVREILLGDGIQSVQATSDGMIWANYFDEGVFGNFGWELPIGAPGLIAWDALGMKRYEFVPTAGLDSICDCYALNVESNGNVWCYYYTEFPLVRIRGFQIDGIWHPGVGGSDAFAVADGYALFRGGYEDRDNYCLIELRDDGRGEKVAEFRLRDEFGEQLIAERAIGRGSSLHLLAGTRVYRLGISGVLESVAR